jgi:hypothetical protein
METSWTTRVSSDGARGAKIFVRKNQLEVGVPISFDREYDGVSALEMTLGALGADIACGMHLLARRKRLEIDHVEVVVEGRLDNPLMWLDVVGETGSTALEEIAVKVYVGTIEDDAAIEAVWKSLLEKSPMIQTLKKAAVLKLSMNVVL